MCTQHCTLPGGYIDNKGEIHRDATITPLTGRDEELLCNKSHNNKVVLITELITRRVQCIGNITPVSQEVAQALLVNDRLFLLLMIRKATFGKKIQSHTRCPWPDCGKKVDIDFSTDDIPIKESLQKERFIITDFPAISGNINIETEQQIEFRLPNGSDQEYLYKHVSKNEARALTLLLTRCIVRIGSIKNPGTHDIENLPAETRYELEKKMESLCPAIDLTFETNCPECNREFSLPFELQDFFFGELQTSADLLSREIHYLAYHYHWSEKEIMDLSRDKRRAYIEILADEIERMNNESQL